MKNAVISHTVTAVFTLAAAMILMMALFEPVPRGSATAANTPVTTPATLKPDHIPGCVYIDPAKSKEF